MSFFKYKTSKITKQSYETRGNDNQNLKKKR